jgi:hypothetical protein
MGLEEQNKKTFCVWSKKNTNENDTIKTWIRRTKAWHKWKNTVMSSFLSRFAIEISVCGCLTIVLHDGWVEDAFKARNRNRDCEKEIENLLIDLGELSGWVEARGYMDDFNNPHDSDCVCYGEDWIQEQFQFMQMRGRSWAVWNFFVELGKIARGMLGGNC